MRVILLLVGAVLAVGLISGAYLLGQRQAPITPIVPTVPKTEPVATEPANTGAQLIGGAGINFFSSPALGIAFNYLEMQNGEKFGHKQTGNKVYVYSTKWPVTQGQYVEVFSKNKNDDLKTAIEKKFLANYSKTDCLAKIGDNPVAKQTAPATFVFAQITVHVSPNDGMEELSAKWDKCPSPYTATNGIAYFVTDTNHPDKFVFFSIGQYAIDAGPNLPWQSTLKFL